MATAAFFGYLLTAVDIAFVSVAWGILYMAFHARNDAQAFPDYLESLRPGDAVAQTPSNVSVPDWSETRRSA